MEEEILSVNCNGSMSFFQDSVFFNPHKKIDKEPFIIKFFILCDYENQGLYDITEILMNVEQFYNFIVFITCLRIFI